MYKRQGHGLGSVNGGAQARIQIRISAAAFGGQHDFMGKAGKNLALLGVLDVYKRQVPEYYGHPRVLRLSAIPSAVRHHAEERSCLLYTSSDRAEPNLGCSLTRPFSFSLR